MEPMEHWQARAVLAAIDGPDNPDEEYTGP
jgi:hypothetical protein